METIKPEAQPQPTPALSAHAKAQDAKLRELFTQHGLTPPPMKPEQIAEINKQAEGAKTPEGELEQKAKDEGKKLEEQAATGEAPKAPATEGGDKKRSPQYEAALHALRRNQTPKKILDTLSDDEVLEWGGRLATAQANVDSMSTQLGDLRKQVGQKGPEAQPKEDPAPAAAPVLQREGQPVDLKAAVQPLMEVLALPADEEGTLVKFAEAITQPLHQQLVGYQAQIKLMNDAVERLLLSETRRELGPRFPQLAQPEVYAKVEEKMASLIKSGGYQSPLELMEDAAKLVIGGTPQPTEPAKARTTAQVTVASRPQGKVALSRDDEETMILQELSSGAKPEDIRRKYGRS